MTELKSFKSYHSYSQFAKSTVPVEEVINEIAKLPLDAVLGFVASLSLEMLKLGGQFDSPQFQGRYLRYALDDDFPRSIPGSAEMIAPGRVPITGGRHTFLHEHNLVWLCHHAILHSNREQSTPEFTSKIICRISRLLLIINDIFNYGVTDSLGTLMERRSFVHGWVRHYQFNMYWRNLHEFIYRLTRQNVLFQKFIPKFFSDLDSQFFNAMGITIQRYFEIVILILGHIYSMALGKHWLSKNNLSSQVESNRHEIDHLLAQWTRTPVEYDYSNHEWKSKQAGTNLSFLYDFVPLRVTPIIEVRPDELVCPIPVFLFAKIEDEPYYIISEHLEEKERTSFHKSIGYAYEDYAHILVERLAKSDSRGKWQIRQNPCAHDRSQLADSYMQRGKLAIVFEHKASRPGSEFLRGGEGERVIGPANGILERLESSVNVSLKEGRKQDKGFLTRGMWQQSIAGPKIIKWAEKEFGQRPTLLIPIITHLSNIQVDEIMRIAYIEPLIERAGLYKESYWIQPQWLHVRELEAMARFAEDGELDLELLLLLKNERYVRTKFDLFMHQYYGGIRGDKEIYDSAMSLLKRSSSAFFPKHDPEC